MQRVVLIAVASFTLLAAPAFAQVSQEAWLEALQSDLFTDHERTDFNGDGVVDFLDLGILASSTGGLGETLALGGVVVPPNNVLFFTHAGGVQPITEVSVALEEVLLLDLYMSFEDVTVGGGITLDFDPGVLAFDDAVFDMMLGDDPLFRCPNTDPGVAITCALAGDDFVSFGGIGGFTGELLIATLQFTASAAGTSPISFTVTQTFSDATGTPLTVPEPAGASIVALLSVAFLRARRSARGSGTDHA